MAKQILNEEFRRMQLLAGVITEGEYKKELKENFLLEEINDDKIEKAVAAALGIQPDQVADKQPTDQEKQPVDESIALTAITIAGLIPVALNLVGDVANKVKELVGLSQDEQKELAKLNELIAGKKKYIKSLDGKNDPREEKERAELEKLEKEKDEKFGTKLGNLAKKGGESLHHLYTLPIRKMLQMVAWTQSKFGKKDGKLQQEAYREKLANIIYAVAMLTAAGFGAAAHLKHLVGVGPIIGTLVDGVKAGKSVAEIVQGVLRLI
jgi:hypothetical protein